MKKIFGVLGMAAVVSATGTLSQAVTYNLGDLIANSSSITYGDKIFGDFGFASAFFPGGAGNATVTPSNVGDTYYLQFQGPWTTMNGGFADIALNYTVATVSGAPLINMIDQSYVLSSGGTGGFITIGETVRTEGFSGPRVAQSSLSFFPGSTPDTEDPEIEPITGDNLYVNPAQAKLWVTKDIAFGSFEGGIIGPTTITQSFHQNSVPDGGSTACLFGSALIGLGLFRRKARA